MQQYQLTRFKCPFVTGAAGFIGSSMVDRLLAQNLAVVGFDNYSTGQERFLESARLNPKFKMVLGDTLDKDALRDAMYGCDVVFHFAANADVRFGTSHPRRDLEQNTEATFNVLEAMRAVGITTIAFSSTGSVYGEATKIPTPEDAPFPIQTSLYGASKLAGESLISAYAEGFGFQGYIFRFVSILGERYTHGHVFDFYKQLLQNPRELKVLGDGTQKKSYLYIQDCLNAIFTAIENSDKKVSIFNLGTDEYVEVNDSIGFICEALGVQPKKIYSGGRQGWIGDNPFIFLDCSKIKNLGWRAESSIRDGVLKTVEFLRANEWVLEVREQ